MGAETEVRTTGGPISGLSVRRPSPRGSGRRDPGGSARRGICSLPRMTSRVTDGRKGDWGDWGDWGSTDGRMKAGKSFMIK